MKAIITIISIVALIVVSDILTSKFYDDELEFYNEHVNKAIQAIESGDQDQAREIIKQMHEHWDAHMQIWGVLSDHYELEAIDVFLHRAELYPCPGYEEDAVQDLTELMRLIVYAASRYNFVMENIF